MSINNELQARKDKVIARGLGNMVPVYVDKADNAELWDVEGNRYIDFGTGIAVLNTGHNNPKVKVAVQEQLERFTHTCFMVTPYESAVELAEKITDLAPISQACKAIFVTTGAEAVENCIKIARAHTGRRGVIAFHGGFHGRTNMAMALTGKVLPYKHQFGPFPGDIYHAPFPIDYHNVSVEDSIAAVNMLFKVAIVAEDVAAIIVEPVQGEGGVYQAPIEFLQALRKLCDMHGIIMIADEIQTGCARTGKMFAMEHSNVEPDMITMAKGIAGGYPIAAVVGKADIMDAPSPGGLGGTYAGSPIACAAALAVLQEVEEKNLTDRATAIGNQFVERLQKLQGLHPDTIGHIRNSGAMIAMELVYEGSANKPNTELPKTLVAAAAKNGLIILSCGIRSNVIRFLPALTISDEIIAEGLSIFEKCMAEQC